VRAIEALQKYDTHKPRDKKPTSLFEDEPSRVLLQFALKLIPPGRQSATRMWVTAQ